MIALAITLASAYVALVVFICALGRAAKMGDEQLAGLGREPRDAFLSRHRRQPRTPAEPEAADTGQPSRPMYLIPMTPEEQDAYPWRVGDV